MNGTCESPARLKFVAIRRSGALGERADSIFFCCAFAEFERKLTQIYAFSINSGKDDKGSKISSTNWKSMENAAETAYERYTLHFTAIGKRPHIFNNIAQER
jgi:hypothetical protein